MSNAQMDGVLRRWLLLHLTTPDSAMDSEAGQPVSTNN